MATDESIFLKNTRIQIYSIFSPKMNGLKPEKLRFFKISNRTYVNTMTSATIQSNFQFCYLIGFLAHYSVVSCMSSEIVEFENYLNFEAAK